MDAFLFMSGVALAIFAFFGGLALLCQGFPNLIHIEKHTHTHYHNEKKQDKA